MAKLVFLLLFATTLVVNSCIARKIGFRRNNFPYLDDGATSRIFSGHKADLGEFPWLVNLEYRSLHNKLELLCAGSIINRRFILTAAQCVTGKMESIGKLISVRVGEHDIRTDLDCEGNICVDPYQRFKIERYIVHPDYYVDGHNRIYNDIALVQLNNDIVYSKSIAPIGLPEKNLPSLIPGQKLTVGGWGAGWMDEVWYGKNIPVKQLENVPYVLNENCEMANSTSHLCAGEFRKDSCDGDGGGSLIRFVNHKPIIEGIVSYGYGCGMETPSVYTRVSSFYDWIRDNAVPVKHE
ncbi:serine protease 7-like [Musca vetustissima]|uniref:serine protease 7-like n=1 Tax=Musca vetustissima TaxID=27455 RepID=UPI002AB7E5BD|nr:serine protease 7-like [Musca vetustissima]